MAKFRTGDIVQARTSFQDVGIPKAARMQVIGINKTDPSLVQIQFLNTTKNRKRGIVQGRSERRRKNVNTTLDKGTTRYVPQSALELSE